MSNLIGQKTSFGFEYDIQSRGHYVMGYMRLWIEGKYIGAYDDVNMLPATLFQFEGLESRGTDGCKFADKTIDEIYESIESGYRSGAVPDNGKYYFNPSESFDDFMIFTYVCDGKIIFIWKLVDRPYFKYPDYPEGLQSAQVSVDEFQKVVMEFKKILSG